MAYRVISESGHGVLVGASQRRRHRSLARNVAITGTALASVSLIAALATLFGHGRGFEASSDTVGHAGTLRITLVDPAPPRIVRRDPRVAILTPGPHIARIAVADVPLPRARPAQMAALVSERPAEDTAAPTGKPAEIASAPRLVPLPAARPVQIASIAAATTAADERNADPEATGSIGEPAHEKAALSTTLQHAAIPAPPHPARKASVAAKPAHKSFFATLFKPARTPFEKLYGPVRLASLTPADTGREDDAGPLRAPYDRHTAVYVIASRKVYLPDGRVLEAHSGLGDKMDDPRFVSVRMRGATPPHMYDLTLRESLFHGIEAIRLTPLGGDDRIFGRSGLLAHSYMLGPSGQSNGCVSFRNYEAFLHAYKSGEITRLAVIARLD